VTVVIDVGCARHGNDYSIERLIEEFSPEVLYGFDPSEAVEVGRVEIGETRCKIERKAAWIYDGEIGFREDGLGSWVTDDSDAPKVPCFDLAKFIRSLGGEAMPILKLDCEAAEYEILDHLIETGADHLLKLVWVEWHPFGPEDHQARRLSIEERIGCPLEEWRW
jgi:FkbM family methyltransferase